MYNTISFLHKGFFIIIIFFISFFITNCATLKRDSKLLPLALQKNLTQIPVKHKYRYTSISQYKVKSLEIFPYKIQVYSQKEELVQGSINFPGRLVLRKTTDFSLIKQTSDGKPPLVMDATAEFSVVRQGILRNSPITIKFYGKTFPNAHVESDGVINPNTDKYFTIAGIAQENLPELLFSAEKYFAHKQTMKIDIHGTLFEKNRKFPHYSETGFLLYKENTVVGFVNKIGRPRVFIDTTLSVEEQNTIITSMLFLLIYNRPTNLNKIAYHVTFEEEQKEITNKHTSNFQ